MWHYSGRPRLRSKRVPFYAVGSKSLGVIQKGRENCNLIRKDSPTYVEQTQRTVGSFTY